MIMFVAMMSVTAFVSLSEDASAADPGGSAGLLVTWSYNAGTETLTLSGTGATYAYSSNARPPWVQASYSVKNAVIGEGISSLGANLFYYSPELESVTFPSTLRSIGESAFRGTRLTEADIPSGVTEIAGHAFRGTKLSSVTIPEGLTILRTYVFADTPLESITIPSNVVTVETYAFSGTKLEHVTIPSNVRTVDTGAFATSTLRTIDIEEGVTTLRLTGSDSLKLLTLPDSVVTLRVDCRSLEKIILGTGTVTIPENCFNGCILLNEIVFSDSVTQFNVRAFAGTPSLLSIELPKNLRSLQITYEIVAPFAVTGTALQNSSFTDIYVHPENQYYESLDGVLYTKGMTQIVKYPQGREGDRYEMPRYVFHMQSHAFYGTKLKELKMSEDLVTIDKNAVYMSSVTISDKVVSVNVQGIYGAEYLKVGNGIVKLTTDIIDYRTLKVLYLGTGVSSTGYPLVHPGSPYAGGPFSSLREVNVDPDNPYFTSVDGIMYSKNMKELVYVPPGWKGEYVMPDSVVYIRERACKDSSFSSVILSEDLIGIGNEAFMNNRNITSVKIPSSVVQIGYQAFRNCVNLRTVFFEGSVLPDMGGSSFDISSTAQKTELRVYSSFPPGFMNRQVNVNMTVLTYYPADITQNGILESILGNTTLLVVILIVSGISVVAAERFISKKRS